MTELLIEGPDDRPATVVLAHGAGAGMEHAFLATVANGLADRGLRVVRFEFPYMHARRSGKRAGPDRLPALQQAFRDVVGQQPRPVALMGKSMGGRVATTIADEVEALCVVVFGYPFHPPKKPEQLRTKHLETLRTPTLILQGERDPFGMPDEVAGYALSPAIEIAWLGDGDHSLAPRKKSGFTVEQHLATAIERAATWVLGRLA
jgi:predicted alpha/beta-hydrolase family hydrolase